MVAELFSGEVLCFPFINVVYCAVEEVFVRINFHCVQWIVNGVLWFGEVLGYGCYRSFLGFVRCGGWGCYF